MNPPASELAPSHSKEDSLKKLNPLAAEFVPSSITDMGSRSSVGNKDFSPSAMDFTAISAASSTNQRNARTRRSWHRRNAADVNSHESIRKTVYISDIDKQISEEFLAEVFMKCGEVVDCRICGDRNSSIGLNIAFVEFFDQDSAEEALRLTGTVLAKYSICVKLSKTAIIPVQEALLPRSEDEMGRCSRTIYCSSIDMARAENLIEFLEDYCGKVVDWKILKNHHSPSTKAALVEFDTHQGAVQALNCSGYCFGSSRIRVSPSKTPLRR